MDDGASNEIIPYLAYAQVLSPRVTLQERVLWDFAGGRFFEGW